MQQDNDKLSTIYNTSSQKLQLDAKDLEKGSKSIDYKIPYAKLEESRVYGGWEEQFATILYQLDKAEGRIYAINFLNKDIDDELLVEIDKDKKENKVKILKSFKKMKDTIQTLDTRRISLSTIDIINRKDISKNPLIYKALDKLIDNYKIYKNNFPQDYYVEFGEYMVESGIQQKKGLLYVRILESLMDCCKLIANSRIFGDVEYNNGGVAIFHLYENYVPRYDGDANGLDKVEHFLFSALISFSNGIAKANIASIGNEVLDWAKQKLGKDNTGFDMSDIKANNAGISYGTKLQIRVLKGLFQ